MLGVDSGKGAGDNGSSTTGAGVGADAGAWTGAGASGGSAILLEGKEVVAYPRVSCTTLFFFAMIKVKKEEGLFYLSSNAFGFWQGRGSKCILYWCIGHVKRTGSHSQVG
jgi:hypothetical protein